MTIQELIDECDGARKEGGNHLVLKVPRNCKGAQGRIAHGLMGAVVGGGLERNDAIYTLLRVKVDAVERWLRDPRSSPPCSRCEEINATKGANAGERAMISILKTCGRPCSESRKP